MDVRQELISPDRVRWADSILAAWRSTLAGVFDAGRLLAEAKEDLPHGDFTRMIERDLPFGPRSAQMLMAIANDERLTNPNHGSLLPANWRTLYELTKLSDDDFEAAIADGTINPECERAVITTKAKKVARQAREVKLAAKIKDLPTEKYAVIYADPEWQFEPYSRETGMDRSADNHYPTSPIDEISGRDVESISADDCVLFLWATAPMLREALIVMGAWGFTYKSQAVWVKDRIGTGFWFRNQHELLLVGTRGDVPAPAMGDQFSSVIMASTGDHSAKPVAAIEIIESYFPNLPKIELNRRGAPRAGWAAWGNEVTE